MGSLAGLGATYVAGAELVLGNVCRIAFLGNRTGHALGRFPHYHRAQPHPNPKPAAKGEMSMDQGISRHRPWETRLTDKSFWDRF